MIIYNETNRVHTYRTTIDTVPQVYFTAPGEGIDAMDYPEAAFDLERFNRGEI